MRRGFRTARRLAVVAAASSLAIAACGGGDGEDSSGDTAPDTAHDSAAPVDEPPAAEPEGGAGTTTTPANGSVDGAAPIDGVLVSLLSFELGLFDVARDTGEHRQVGIEGVGYTDRERQPTLSLDGVTAYTLTYTPLEGQSYSHDVGVGAVDRRTGEGRLVTTLGVDRTDDESPDLTSYRLLGADAGTVWVQSNPFAESDPALVVYTSYDVDTGAEITSLTDVAQRDSNTDGECEVEVRNAFLGSAGGLIGVSGGWPAAIDPATGEVTPLVVGCLEFEEPSLGSVIGTEGVAEFLVVRDDRPLDPETLESLAGITEISVTGGEVVEGDDSLWWVFNRNVTTFQGDEQIQAIAGGVVRYDLAGRRIADVWPLGDAVGEWLPEEESGDYSALSQPQLQYLDGSVWIMDHRDDRPLLRVDGTTGVVTEIPVSTGSGFDRVSAELIPNDPDAIWLDVVRWVTTETDDGGTSSSGEGFLDQVDLATDEIVVTVSQTDILGL